MPTARASRELPAPPEEVWGLLSEPYHLADWWPGLATVEPDRHGVAVGARWKVRSREATLLRKAGAEDMLVVTRAEPGSNFGFDLVRARVRVELTLAPSGPDGTLAELSVAGPFTGFSRHLPETALARLAALCQTVRAI